MTRVDFYIISDESRQSDQRLVCSLAQKALDQGHRVHIQAADEQQASQLDDLLWRWQDISFLPHALAPEADADTPVHIGHSLEEPIHDGILINMMHPTPGFFSRFERVLEIVDRAPEVRTQARDRYRYYKDRGYPLHKHDV